MFPDVEGANELTIKEIEDILMDEGAGTPPASDGEDVPPVTQPTDKGKVDTTQAFANRLKAATTKAREEERENIAKGMGFESFDALQKSKEADILKSKGFDPDELSPVIEDILAKRLAEDPSLKELAEFRQKKVEDWAKKELEELSTLTNGKISKKEDMSKEVLELWKKKGSLKAAYLELEGEKLIREMRTSIASGQSKGSTDHLKNPSANPSPQLSGEKRPLTDKEKSVYKMFNPKITDEQLSKILKDK